MNEKCKMAGEDGCRCIGKCGGCRRKDKKCVIVPETEVSQGMRQFS